jgi:hypothetical protein
MNDPITARQFHEADGAEVAPSWWTLADAAGNEADVAITTGRD